jgi:pimeloyl-ACP methyl ester carboxylesterase
MLPAAPSLSIGATKRDGFEREIAVPVLQIADTRLHYEQSGVGPPLVLLAGLASDSASWGPLLPFLEDRFTVLRPDNRGAGRTRCPNDQITTKAMLVDLTALCDHLGAGPVNLVGHSMGAMLGLRLAAAHPDRVAKLVVLAGTPTPRPKTVALFEDMARLRELKIPMPIWYRLLFQWLFAPSFFASSAELDAAAEAALSYPFRQSDADFLAQSAALHEIGPVDLAAIKAPVLAIDGALDLLNSPETIRAALTGLPAVTHKTITGAAHAVHWDQPEATAKAILDFL